MEAPIHRFAVEQLFSIFLEESLKNVCNEAYYFCFSSISYLLMSFIYPKLSKHAQLLFEKVNQVLTKEKFAPK